MDTVKRFLKGLTWTQVVSAAAAAMTALLLSTQIGVAGSVLGAAVSSIISTFATTIYKNTLNEGAKAVKKKAGLPVDETTVAAKAAGEGAAEGDAPAAEGRVGGTAALINPDPTRSMAGDATTAGLGATAYVARHAGEAEFDDGSTAALESLDDPNTVSFPAVRAAGAGTAAWDQGTADGTRRWDYADQPSAHAGSTSPYSRASVEAGRDGATRAWTGTGADAYSPSATSAHATTGSSRYAGAGYAPGRDAAAYAAGAQGRSGARGGKAWQSFKMLVVGLLVAGVALYASAWVINWVTEGNGWGIKTAIVRGTEEVSEALSSLLGSSGSSSSADTTTETSNAATETTATTGTQTGSAGTTATTASQGQQDAEARAPQGGATTGTGGTGATGATTTSPASDATAQTGGTTESTGTTTGTAATGGSTGTSTGGATDATTTTTTGSGQTSTTGGESTAQQGAGGTDATGTATATGAAS
ncbi:MAG: hypothetical protein SOI26_03980 [Coriobacteriales bacterium]|jgi:hypothetical protein